MTKKMTATEALALLADNAAANTKAVKELTALLGEVTTKPENGKNGETPYIKEGYWWIGSTNTGVKAAFSIPFAAFHASIVPQELSEEDKEKIASGDYIEDSETTKTLIEVGQKYNGWLALVLREDSLLTSTVVNGVVSVTYHEPEYSSSGLQVFLYKPEEAVSNSYYQVKAVEKVTEPEKENSVVLASLDEVLTPYDGGGTELGLITLRGKNKQGESVERHLELGKDKIVVTEIEANNEYQYYDSSTSEVNKGQFYPGEDGYLESNYVFSASAKAVRIEITTKEGFTISRTVENRNYHG